MQSKTDLIHRQVMRPLSHGGSHFYTHTHTHTHTHIYIYIYISDQQGLLELLSYLLGIQIIHQYAHVQHKISPFAMLTIDSHANT